jgi:acyl-CoA synthetase (NDP forming)
LERFNGRVVKNLLRHGFPGRVYPVNPKYEKVAGIDCFGSLSDLPEMPETVFIAVGRDRVLDVMRESAALGIPTATIYTAGFSEVDETGAEIEAEIASLARDAGMCVCGPNTAGYHNFAGRVQLAGIIALEVDHVIPGNVGVVVQSGSIGGALISRATHRGIGFSYLISCGNEMDLEASAYIDYMIKNDQTRSIAIYLEGLKNPRKFLETAERALAAGKPMVVCKVGRSSAGRAAAVSHTGALVGEDRAFEAAFRQYGITRVDGLEELFEVAHMFAVSPLPKGRRVGVLTTSGGAGALVADECGALGLEIPSVSQKLKARIHQTLPDFIAVHNPIDTTIAGIGSFQQILDILLEETSGEDGSFDIFSAVVGSSAQFRHAIAVDPIVQAKAEGRTGDTPLLVYFNPYSEEAHRKMAAAGIPSFHTTEGCARAAAHLWRHAEFVAGRGAESGPVSPIQLPKVALAHLLPGPLGEARSLALAEAFGFRVAPYRIGFDINEILAAATELGYPVVLKASSPDIQHKSDRGLVAAGLVNKTALQNAFLEISQNLENENLPRKDGFLVQKMIPGGMEVLLGAIRDPQFGPLITLGMGGIAAEAMGDITVRLSPVSSGEAERMLDELRCAPLLDAFRGRGPLDRKGLVEAIVRFGAMVTAMGDKLLEADMNPLMVLPEGEGVFVLDAMLVMNEPGESS